MRKTRRLEKFQNTAADSSQQNLARELQRLRIAAGKRVNGQQMTHNGYNHTTKVVAFQFQDELFDIPSTRRHLARNTREDRIQRVVYIRIFISKNEAPMHIATQASRYSGCPKSPRT